jgi:hypothetical protein
LQADPDDSRANLYYAMTRIVTKLLNDGRTKGLLSRGQR